MAGFPEYTETERLILRPFLPSDLPAHVEILSNWDVTRWLSTDVPFPYSLEDGEKFIAAAMTEFADGISIRYMAEDKASGRMVGSSRIFSVTAETEVGYSLHPDFWGGGYGTEVLRATLSIGFDHGVITCFTAQTAAENMASRRILEKTGFVHMGMPPPEYARCGHDQGCSEFYRLVIEDWK